MIRLLALLLFALPAWAQPPCWEAQFASGNAIVPVGITQGRVLWSEGHFPKLKARIQGSVWKGKTFDDCGIINRWVGFNAVRTGVTIEPSLVDGQPCVVMQYGPRQFPFSNVRDELRQIAPGTWLGRALNDHGEVKCYFILKQTR